MARERYLLHADEEGKNSPEAEKKPDTPKSKFDNFMYYHKIHLIILLCVAVVAGIMIRDVVTKVNPDYQIGLVTQQSYPDQLTQALENQIAKYGEDLNGDGKVVVQISNYVIAADPSATNIDPNMQMAGITRLMGDLQTGESMIFITDDASFKTQQEKNQVFSYLDGSMPKEGATDYQKMRISLKNCDKLAASAKDMGDLSISLRVYKGSQLEGKKGLESYFAASKRLMDKLTSNP